MAQLIIIPFIFIWLFRSPRKSGKNGLLWATVGIGLFIGWGVLASAIANETLVPILLRQKGVEGAEVGMFLGLFYYMSGLALVAILQKRVLANGSHELSVSKQPFSLLRAGVTMLVAAIVGSAVGIAVDFAMGREPLDPGLLPRLTYWWVLRSVGFVLLLRLAWRPVPTVLTWVLIMSGIMLLWLTKEVRFPSPFFQEYILPENSFVALAIPRLSWLAISSAFSMTGVAIGLRLKSVTWWKFILVYSASGVVGQGLKLLYRLGEVEGIERQLLLEKVPAQELEFALVTIAFAVPLYWGLQRSGCFHFANQGIGDQR